MARVSLDCFVLISNYCIILLLLCKTFQWESHRPSRRQMHLFLEENNKVVFYSILIIIQCLYFNVTAKMSENIPVCHIVITRLVSTMGINFLPGVLVPGPMHSTQWPVESWCYIMCRSVPADPIFHIWSLIGHLEIRLILISFRIFDGISLLRVLIWRA